MKCDRCDLLVEQHCVTWENVKTYATITGQTVDKTPHCLCAICCTKLVHSLVIGPDICSVHDSINKFASCIDMDAKLH